MVHESDLLSLDFSSFDDALTKDILANPLPMDLNFGVAAEDELAKLAGAAEYDPMALLKWASPPESPVSAAPVPFDEPLFADFPPALMGDNSPLWAAQSSVMTPPSSPEYASDDAESPSAVAATTAAMAHAAASGRPFRSTRRATAAAAAASSRSSSPVTYKRYVARSMSDSDDDSIIDGEFVRGGTKRRPSQRYTDDEEPTKVKRARKVKARRERDELTAKHVAAVRSVSSLAESPESKRHVHNILERKRRNDLKNSYQELRENIPELEDADRAPTGQILNKTVEYIHALIAEEARLKAGVAAAREENARLVAAAAAAGSL